MNVSSITVKLSFIIQFQFLYASTVEQRILSMTPDQWGKLIFGGFGIFILCVIALHCYYKMKQRRKIQDKIFRQAVNSMNFQRPIVSVRACDSRGSLDSLVML